MHLAASGCTDIVELKLGGESFACLPVLVALLSVAFVGFIHMTPTEPLLFSLLADDWKDLASFFVTPTIGISVAYLLGADLLKVPFISTDVPYKIPGRILAIFTLLVGLLRRSVLAYITGVSRPPPKRRKLQPDIFSSAQ